MMSNELLELVGLLNSELLWLYIAIVIIVFYAILSLLTWSFKKPLMFLGIPSIVVGVLLIIIRFSVSVFIPSGAVSTILDSAVKPLFTTGIICIVVGIVMIIVYEVLNKIQEKKKIVEEPQF